MNRFAFLAILIVQVSTESPTIYNKNPNDVHFYLYNNPQNYSLEAGVLLDVNNVTSILSAHLIENVATKIIIHGFTKSYKCWVPQEVKDTYFQRGVVANIIAVDWKKLAVPIDDPTETVSYPFAVANVNITGVRVAKLIELLVERRNVSLKNIHLVGFSLGAHVAGEAGLEIQKRMGGEKVGRITGLDPAGPLFYSGEFGRHLRKTDAEFVDAIHTAIGMEGISEAVGAVDFYMNDEGFAPQPGCDQKFDVVPRYCSHDTAPKYFMLSIGRTDLCACSLVVYLANKCKCGLPAATSVVFGENAKPGTSGLYFMKLKAPPLSGKYSC